jgi:hypothetical protein
MGDNESTILCKFEDHVGIDLQIKGYQVENFYPYGKDKIMSEIYKELLENISCKFNVKFKFVEKMGKIYYSLLNLELVDKL